MVNFESRYLSQKNKFKNKNIKYIKTDVYKRQHLNIDVPVYGGMPLPMVREQVVADMIHGESGLDGPRCV